MVFFSKRMLFSCVGFLCLLLAVGCEKEFPLQPDALIGKSKKEVIALTMAFAERTSNDEVNFAIQNPNGHFENYYYRTPIEAEQAGRLQKSNVWQVFFMKVNTLFGFHRKSIEIIFRDDRVYQYKVNTISDGF